VTEALGAWAVVYAGIVIEVALAVAYVRNMDALDAFELRLRSRIRAFWRSRTRSAKS
jgi:hypothetical protein